MGGIKLETTGREKDGEHGHDTSIRKAQGEKRTDNTTRPTNATHIGYDESTPHPTTFTMHASTHPLQKPAQ
jgi:hypothetical protein